MKRRIVSHVVVALALAACAKTPFTGSNVLILTSESQEAQLGDEAYREILRKTPEARRSRWTELVEQVGARVAAVAEKPDFRWEFRLLQSTEANAFCLPGGKVAVYTGMMRYFRDEAELAAVIGHEVAHATARHGGQRITMQFGTQIGFSVLAELMGGESMSPGKRLLLQALGLGATIGAVLPFSRGQESEADYIGLQYAALAGYAPEAAVSFWQSFGAQGGQRPPTWLSTHPSPANRVQELSARLADARKRYEGSPRRGRGERISPRQLIRVTAVARM